MRISARAAACGLLVAWTAACAEAQTRPPTPAAAPVVVLDTLSVWRIHETLKPPVIQFDDGLRTLTSQYEWLDWETDAAPADWTKPEFSDANWLRGSVRSASRTPYLADQCLRARFEVTDPARVKDLKVSVAYYGGAIVSVNGREIARGQLPKPAPSAVAGDARGPAALAENYTREAYLTDKGELVPTGYMADRHPAALAARERKLTDISIPAAALRKGVNVLAIEVIRAPYDKVLEEKKSKTAIEEKLADRNCPWEFNWNTCEVRQVRLTAGSAEGLVPNASRPKELQAWRGDLLTADYDSDFGDRCEAPGPVDLRGPRNGYLSGKLVVGCANAIENLKVTCGNLTNGAASFPASRVRIRYAVPFGSTASNGDDHGRGASLLDCLLEGPLDSFPARRWGAVVPIWFTIQAPADAKPGVYSGQVTVEAKGHKPLTVPLRAEVADFAVPDTQDYKTWIELMQSPDTLAAEYKAPLWSDKHWELIAQSMRYMGEIGSRVVHVPLIAQTNSGNEQSMVRFIPKEGGTYDYDFSVVDKYLDAAEKNMGRPKIVAFIAWDIYLKTPKAEVKVDPNEGSYVSMEKSWQAARWQFRGKGPLVTTLNPATKELGTTFLPRFDDPAAKAVWKPLFDELHKRMAKRGLEKTMCLGMASDVWGSKEEMTTLQEVSGNLPWINHTHGGGHVGTKLAGVSPVAYTAYVWNVKYAQDPNKGRTYGWKRPELYAEFRRFTSLNEWPLATIHLFPEIQITGQQRGVGRVGADFWPVLRDKQGHRRGWIWAPYLQSMWHSCQLSSHLLVPGPTGPVASTRYELMREGIQQCEARIAIEQVLTDESLKAKAGPELAGRSQRLLDDRVWRMLKAYNALQLNFRVFATSKNTWGYGAGSTAGHYWYISDGWRDRAQTLYDLAGEVTRKTAEK